MEPRLSVAIGLALVVGLVAHRTAGGEPRVRVDGVVTALGFDQGGKWVAVGFRDGEGRGRVRVYATSRRYGDSVDLPSMKAPVTWAAFVADDEYVAVADENGEVVVWSWPELTRVLRLDLTGQSERTDLRFQVVGNPRGPHIAWVTASASGDGGVGASAEVTVARLPGGKVITRFNKIGVEPQVAWSEDGAHLVLGGAVWNWDTLESWSPDIPGVTAVSADGRRAASAPPVGCDGISIADLPSKKILRTIPTRECPRQIWFGRKDTTVFWLAADPDDDAGSILYRWEAKRDLVDVVEKGLPAAEIFALAPDRRQFAVADARRVRFVRVR